MLIICLPLVSAAQKIPDLGIGKVRITLSDKTIAAELTANARDFTPKTDKTYYWYGSNAIHATQAGYSGRLLNGQYTEYYLNKNLKVQGNFKEGLKTGVWKKWDQDGRLTETAEWRKGLLDGDATTYAANDSVRVMHYRDGKIRGTEPSLLQRLHLARRDSVSRRKKENKPAQAPVKPRP